MRLVHCAVSSALLATLLLSGCSIATTAVPSSLQGASLQGIAHGGQQGIGNAKVYLLEADTSAYGHASKSLLSATFTGNTGDSIGSYVLTSADGGFSITGDYACDTGAQVYVYVLGGNTGGNTANIHSGLMAALGQCPAGTVTATTPNFLSTIPFIYVNEVSTVAAAYALAGFSTDALTISAPSADTVNHPTSATGIANAFANVANLAGISTGVAPLKSVGNWNVPQATINTLANILAACVSTNGALTAATVSPVAPASNCYTLFSNATSDGVAVSTIPGLTVPSDTASAAINLAHHPGNNMTALYGLQSGIGSPFLPDLSAQPNDFVLGLTTSISSGSGVAIDAAGSAWIASNGGDDYKFASNTAHVSGSPFSIGTLFTPQNISIDPSGNVWVTDQSSFSVGMFTNSGTGTAYSVPQTNFAIATDGSNHVWVGMNSAIAKLNTPNGTSAATPLAAAVNAPTFAAIDSAGNAWFTNSSTLSKVNSANTVLTSLPPYVQHPFSLALDAADNVWIADASNGVLNLTSSGALIGSSPFSGAPIYMPEGIAVDGAGHIWVTSSNLSGTLNTLVELNSAGTQLSPAAGYSPSLSTPMRPTIDGSGNIWLYNQGNNIFEEIIGIATPVVTPLSANFVSPYTHAASLP